MNIKAALILGISLILAAAILGGSLIVFGFSLEDSATAIRIGLEKLI